MLETCTLNTKNLIENCETKVTKTFQGYCLSLQGNDSIFNVALKQFAFKHSILCPKGSEAKNDIKKHIKAQCTYTGSVKHIMSPNEITGIKNNHSSCNKECLKDTVTVFSQ